jgi:hypothetical protein
MNATMTSRPAEPSGRHSGHRLTQHGAVRVQQRALPPQVLDWLHTYGHEHHDGHGAMILYFNKPARRRRERAVGREPVRRMKQWLNAYAVVSSEGQVINAGHRFRRVWQ